MRKSFFKKALALALVLALLVPSTFFATEETNAPNQWIHVTAGYAMLYINGQPVGSAPVGAIDSATAPIIGGDYFTEIQVLLSTGTAWMNALFTWLEAQPGEVTLTAVAPPGTFVNQAGIANAAPLYLPQVAVRLEEYDPKTPRLTTCARCSNNLTQQKKPVTWEWTLPCYRLFWCGTGLPSPTPSSSLHNTATHNPYKPPAPPRRQTNTWQS